MPAPASRLQQLRDGEEHFLAEFSSLADESLAQPSRLPDWTRAHLVAHVARNADALGNLLDWARTGVETPMYRSTQQRAADIEATARLDPGALRSEAVDATARLLEAVDMMPVEAWDAPVRTASGRAIPAAEVPWMRIRETWIHSVDLGAGATFSDLPAPVVGDLLGEVTAGFAGSDDAPAIVLVDTETGRSWSAGSGVRIEVTGRSPQLLEWLLGRDDGAALTTDGVPLPALPSWL